MIAQPTTPWLLDEDPFTPDLSSSWLDLPDSVRRFRDEPHDDEIGLRTLFEHPESLKRRALH
jgi:hypothetical protein